MSERRMTDTMWEAAKLLWNAHVPGWQIAQYYGIAQQTLWNHADTHDGWNDRSAYANRRVNPERRQGPRGGRREDDPLMRCQECQQCYRGEHVCRRVA